MEKQPTLLKEEFFGPQAQDKQPRISEGKGLLGAFSQYK